MIRLLFRYWYKFVGKPLLFMMDAEQAHELAMNIGEAVGKRKSLRTCLRAALRVERSSLKITIRGLDLDSPIGLAAGFDYDGHGAEVLPSIGFGFNTVGTVTFQAYAGNAYPRLGRLPKSRSLFVNKGLKSEGAVSVRDRLRAKSLTEGVVGISIGSSNIPKIDTIPKAIEDYLEGFRVFMAEPYVRYFELNVSCPNAILSERFTEPRYLEELLRQLHRLSFRQPLFLKMPSDLRAAEVDAVVQTALAHGVDGFICSNLLKDRANPSFDKDEIAAVANQKGNFSGRPTQRSSDELVRHVYQRYGREATVIGCGGIFSAEDAYRKIRLGASALQLITGMVYEGPQLVGDIAAGLAQLLARDGCATIRDAVGQGARG